jgi:hypothetical protein
VDIWGQEHPAASEDQHNENWLSFLKARESEEQGSCADLNLVGGKKYWWATKQGTSASASG